MSRMLNTMDSIRSDIRSLIAKYGMQAVHHELQNEMRESYDFLRQHFEPSKNNLVIPMKSVIPDRIATPHLKPIATTVVAIEPPNLELEVQEEVKHNEDVQEQVITEEVPKDSSLKEVVIQAKKEMAQETGEKMTKARHRELVNEKWKELTSKEIKPETLLTKENLSEWLGKGYSYMRIAREYVGLPENEIAMMAKRFGLQSDMKKYIVMKKGSK